MLSICSMSLPVYQRSLFFRADGISVSSTLKWDGLVKLTLLSVSSQTESVSNWAEEACFCSISIFPPAVSHFSFRSVLISLIVYTKPKPEIWKRKDGVLVGNWRGNGWNERHCISPVPWQDRNSKIKTRGSTFSSIVTSTRAVVSDLSGGAKAHRKGTAQVNGKHLR